MVEASGYTYNPPPAVVPNSHAALEVTELARDRGLHEAVHTRLMDAYWSEAQNIGDRETLLDLAASAGLDRSEAADVIADDATETASPPRRVRQTCRASMRSRHSFSMRGSSSSARILMRRSSARLRNLRR